jgi:hypothetical protein
MEQCVDYLAASAAPARGNDGSKRRSCSCQQTQKDLWSRRGDDEMPVKLLSINTNVGCESCCGDKWTVDSGLNKLLLARLNQHRRRVSSFPARYQTETP